MSSSPVPAAIGRDSVDTLLARVSTGDGPGGVVAVRHRGRLVVQRAFGLANLEQGSALRWNDRLPIGSITKQFTAALMLGLSDRQVLQLDDAVGRWLPELPSPLRAPTLHQLLNHTGGMRCHLDQWMFDGYTTLPAGDPWRRLLRQQSLNFDPGTASSYSNGGYVLLSLAIERATSMPFASALQRFLLAPVGLQASGLPSASPEPDAAVAQTYLRQGERWTSAPAMTVDRYGDGGMASTAGDLLRWAHYLQDSSASRRRLDRFVQRVDPGQPSRYGLGLISQHWRGHWVVQHAGGLPGANSVLLMLPDDELDVVVLLNRPGPAMSLGFGLADLALGDTLAPPLPEPRGSDHTDLLGTYRSEATGWVFAFEEDGGSLNLSLFGDRSVPLDGLRAADDQVLPLVADIGTGDTWFRVRERDEAGRVKELDYFDGICWRRAHRIERQSVDVRRMAAELAGTFASDEAGATLCFDLDSAGLLLRATGERGEGCYRAEAWTGDLLRFWPSQFPVSKMVRLEREHGRVKAVEVSTGRTRALRFVRISDA